MVPERVDGLMAAWELEAASRGLPEDRRYAGEARLGVGGRAAICVSCAAGVPLDPSSAPTSSTEPSPANL